MNLLFQGQTRGTLETIGFQHRALACPWSKPATLATAQWKTQAWQGHKWGASQRNQSGRMQEKEILSREPLLCAPSPAHRHREGVGPGDQRVFIGCY